MLPNIYIKDKLFIQIFGETSCCIASSLLFQVYSHINQSRKFFHPNSRRSREFLLAKTMMVVVLGMNHENIQAVFRNIFSYKNIKLPKNSYSCFSLSLPHSQLPPSGAGADRSDQAEDSGVLLRGKQTINGQTSDICSFQEEII